MFALQSTFPDRLREAVKGRYGSLDREALSRLARDAGVHYTTVARLVLYPKSRRTTFPRRSTLNAIALALDVNPGWLSEGQGTQQLGLWPILLPVGAESTVGEPVEQVRVVVRHLTSLPDWLLLKACRAAISAALEVVVSNGAMVSPEVYRCLMRLDALHRSLQKPAAG